MFLSNMREKNLLKSSKSLCETRKIMREHVLPDENGIVKAGTPYPQSVLVGKNLLRNADLSQGDKAWGGAQGSNVSYGRAVVEHNGKKVMAIKHKVVDPKKELGPCLVAPNTNQEIRTERLKHNKMTISFKAMNHPTAQYTDGIQVYVNDLVFFEHLMLTDELTEYTATKEYEPTDTLVNFYFRTANETKRTIQDMYVTDVKLEFGERTAFSIAPEDGGPLPNPAEKVRGLIFEDIDFNDKTNSVKTNTVLVSGVVHEKRLPVPIDAKTKAQLNRITFYSGD